MIDGDQVSRLSTFATIKPKYMYFSRNMYIFFDVIMFFLTKVEGRNHVVKD